MKRASAKQEEKTVVSGSGFSASWPQRILRFVTVCASSNKGRAGRRIGEAGSATMQRWDS